MTIEIPPELYPSIFVHIFGKRSKVGERNTAVLKNWEDLKNCASVSRLFRQELTPLFFDKLNLTFRICRTEPIHRLEKFLDLAVVNPILPSSVSNLTVRFVDSRRVRGDEDLTEEMDQEEWTKSFGAVFASFCQTLVSLHSFRPSGPDYGPNLFWNRCGGKIQDGLKTICLMPSLRRISESMRLPRQLLFGNPNVTSMVMRRPRNAGDVGSVHTNTEGLEGGICTMLQELIMHGASPLTGHIPTFTTDFPQSIQRLQRLTISLSPLGGYDDEIRLAQSLLNATCNTLTTIYFEDSENRLAYDLDLSQMKTLEHLSIDCIIRGHRPSPFEPIIHECPLLKSLSASTTPAFRSLTLDFIYAKFYDVGDVLLGLLIESASISPSNTTVVPPDAEAPSWQACGKFIHELEGYLLRYITTFSELEKLTLVFRHRMPRDTPIPPFDKEAKRKVFEQLLPKIWETTGQHTERSSSVFSFDMVVHSERDSSSPYYGGSTPEEHDYVVIVMVLGKFGEGSAHDFDIRQTFPIAKFGG